MTATHTLQNIRFIRAGTVLTRNPRKQDNSAHGCNSRFSNRDGDKDGDKETKLTDCSFKQSYNADNMHVRLKALYWLSRKSASLSWKNIVLEIMSWAAQMNSLRCTSVPVVLPKSEV